MSFKFEVICLFIEAGLSLQNIWHMLTYSSLYGLKPDNEKANEKIKMEEKNKELYPNNA